MADKILGQLAARYIWWKTPEEALRTPERIAAQVMDLGDYEDVLHLIDHLGEDYLRRVLQHAEAGQFSPRSWVYWHYRLGMATPGLVPQLPQRRVA